MFNLREIRELRLDLHHHPAAVFLMRHLAASEENRNQDLVPVLQDLPRLLNFGHQVVRVRPRAHPHFLDLLNVLPVLLLLFL